MNTPLINKHYTIEKMAGKGGWSFVVISEIPTTEKGPLGLIRVSGFIDTYELKQFNLLPLKNGSMMLPLKTAVRKKSAKKKAIQFMWSCMQMIRPWWFPMKSWFVWKNRRKRYNFFYRFPTATENITLTGLKMRKKLKPKLTEFLKPLNVWKMGKDFMIGLQIH